MRLDTPGPNDIARRATKPQQLRLDGLRPVRFPRTRVRDLCASAIECHRLGHLVGADLCAAAAAVLVGRYLDRRDSGCAK